MLYCESCQVLSRDDEVCPLCGGKKLRLPTASDPVLLYTAGGTDADLIAAAFDDAGIPHMERMLACGSASSVLLGQNRCAQTRFFVPYGETERAEDVLHGIGVLKDSAPEQQDPEARGSEKKQAATKEQIPMSRGRRIALRIFSVLAFCALVWLAVLAADSIVAFVRTVFH